MDFDGTANFLRFPYFHRVDSKVSALPYNPAYIYWIQLLSCGKLQASQPWLNTGISRDVCFCFFLFFSYQPLPVQAQSSKPYPGILVNFRSTSKPGKFCLPQAKFLENFMCKLSWGWSVFVCRYVGVGENEEVQLFYMFVKSQRNPVLDPLVMWLTGGPGCSTFSAFFYGNGTNLTFPFHWIINFTSLGTIYISVQMMYIFIFRFSFVLSTRLLSLIRNLR